MDIKVSVPNTGTLLVPANSLRRKLILINTDASNNVYISKAGGAVSGSGILLAKGGGFYADERDSQGYIFTGPIAAISDGGTPSVIGSEE